MSKRYLDGFDPLSEINADGLLSVGVTTAVTIAKGDCLVWASGYASLETSLDVDTIGIAAHAADNASGASGAINVLVIPILELYRFRVPVEANALITTSAIGTLCDLESEDGIDINDTSMTAKGFYIDGIDVSAAAVAINTYGYAIGSFRAVT